MPEHKKDIPLPSIEEQKAFVAKMKEIEAEIEAAETKEEKNALEQKKHDLMEAMFGEE